MISGRSSRGKNYNYNIYTKYMIVEGKKKNLIGDFYLRRYVNLGGESRVTATYKIGITAQTISVFLGEKEITDLIQHIQFLPKNEVLMWIKPSRLGLLYKLESK